MGLFKTIDGLLIGTRYLCWGLGVLGMAGSVVLMAVNLSMGIGAVMTFAAALLLSIAVTLLLLPDQIAKGALEGNKRYIVGAVLLILATAVMGIVYFANGGFPALNLMALRQMLGCKIPMNKIYR